MRPPRWGRSCAEGHISIGQESGHQFIDDLLDRAAGGRAREIRATVPNFLLLPYLLEGTDLLGFAPQGVARRLVAERPLRLFALPFKPPVSEVSLYTRRGTVGAPEIEWFRGMVRDALGPLGATGTL